MAIAPISSVSFRNNSRINFTSGVKNDSEGQKFVPSQRKGTTDLGKMPVVVLLALTPEMMDAKVPERFAEIGNAPRIEVINDVLEPETNAEISQNAFIYRPFKDSPFSLCGYFAAIIDGDLVHLLISLLIVTCLQ